MAKAPLMKKLPWCASVLAAGYLATPNCDVMAASSLVSQTPADAAQWRNEHRLVDLHQHLECNPERLARAIKVMDATGLGIVVNLSGGTVTRTNAEPSAFERNKEVADRLFPDRILHYMNLDYEGWDEPEFSERAVRQVEEGHRLGAAGLKEFKRLGLVLRDKAGRLLKIDDPKLDPVWTRCGELGMPVSIHVADPRAFWMPYDDKNERWAELQDHRQWWFGDPNLYPPREELLAALNRVIERHPKTTFVCVHFANNAEDLDWVGRQLDRYPNMNADLAARIPEIGRQPPAAVRELFLKHQDRILFATDFQVYGQLTLGSGGKGPAPTDEDAVDFYSKHWRWLETNDRNFAHMTPIQGDWTISGIGLPVSVLRKIYFDNAQRLLARSMPLPVTRAARTPSDFEPDGHLSNPSWNLARPVRIEYQTDNIRPHPELSTAVRALWSERYLYLGYEAPFSKLTVFEPADRSKKRVGLWEKDVVEAFIAPDPQRLNHYGEFEVAPNGEWLDLMVRLPEKEFDWQSHWDVRTTVDHQRGVWRAEVRIPIASLASSPPHPGVRWRINLFRCDREHRASMAWSPTRNQTFHTPERFGWLEFER